MDDSGFDSDPKIRQSHEDDRLFPASDSSTSSANLNHSTPRKMSRKQLHKKLERRIEQAKKLQVQNEMKKNPQLIPIQRLPIPTSKPPTSPRENHPLVDWETDDSDEDINFFPVSRMRDGKQELTDTFSIEDFEVTPEEDDLDLLPPKPLDRRLLCCGVPLHWTCSIL
uniref:Uncharacterized protein n=1 Tax=Graphocephala atropunctata TaxID=36148 RepID=A0A1B6MUG5_9HEMI